MEKELELQLLEELQEKDIPAEAVEFAEDINPIRRIGRILEGMKPNFYFDQMDGDNLPEMALMYYFAKDMNPKTVNKLLGTNPKDGFFNIIISKIDENNSLITEVLPEISQLRFMRQCTNQKKTNVWDVNNELNPVLQYVSFDIKASMAAQRLIENIPLVGELAPKIRNARDLVDALFYSQIIVSVEHTDNNDLIARIKELVHQDKTVREIFDESSRLLFSNTFRNYFAMLDLVKEGKPVEKEVFSGSLNELFNPYLTKTYERIACLTELVDDVAIIRNLFPSNEVYDEFNRDKDMHDMAKMNFATLLKRVGAEFTGETDGVAYRKAQAQDFAKLNKVRYVSSKEGQPITITGHLTHECPSCKKWCIMASDGKGGIHIDNKNFVEVAIPIDEYFNEFNMLSYKGYNNACEEFMLELDKQNLDAFKRIKNRVENTTDIKKYMTEEKNFKIIKERLDMVYK